MIPLHIDSLDPAFNLAFEEVLCNTLPADHPGWLLLWRNGPSVIVGRFQNTAAEVNARYIEANAIRVVRRNTGGGAVYHDEGNLNFSFIMPRGAKGDGPFEDFSFSGFLGPMVDAMRDLGVAAELSGRNDMLTDGAKFSGSAQRQTKTMVLHHGTLLIDLDMSILGQALAGDPEKFKSKGLASVRSRVTNLRPYLREGTDMRAVMEAIVARCAPGEVIRTAGAFPCEASEAEALAASKYRTWEWNYGSSPAFDEARAFRFPWGKLEMHLRVEEGIIRDCRFYGDFFSAADPEQIAGRLRGVTNRAEALRQALDDAPVEACFSGSSREEVVAFLSGD